MLDCDRLRSSDAARSGSWCDRASGGGSGGM